MPTVASVRGPNEVWTVDFKGLYQAFRQRTAPGRLSISLDAGLQLAVNKLKEKRSTNKKADTTVARWQKPKP